MRAAKRVPKYRRQKERSCHDRAFVDLDGHRVHLGEYDTEASRQRYDRLIAQWLANGRSVPPPVADDPDDVTIVELAAAFMRHANEHYRKNGTTTSSVDIYKAALRPLVRLYGDIAATSFGPMDLQAVRETWVQDNLARSSCNQYTATICQVFRWGVSRELVSETVYRALALVPDLQRGRTAARETERVRPVPATEIRAVRPYVSRQVRAMIQIQRLTGIRPGEVVTLRACDIQMTGRVWTYRPASHKTEHHDLEREAWFGPRAQKVLRLFLDREPRACLFSPADAESERQAERHAARRTPATCGNRPGPRGCGGWRPGNRYSVASYRKAIHRACVKAGVPKWNPNRIRHNMATSVRREHGIELSQAVLGHQLGSRVTEVYAETNRQKARDVIAMVG